jgi:hypothetical protein
MKNLNAVEKMVVEMKMLELGIIPYMNFYKFHEHCHSLKCAPWTLNRYKRKFRKIKKKFAKRYGINYKHVSRQDIIFELAATEFPKLKEDFLIFVKKKKAYNSNLQPVNFKFS